MSKARANIRIPPEQCNTFSNCEKKTTTISSQSGLISDSDVCWIATEMLWIHYLVGVLSVVKIGR